MTAAILDLRPAAPPGTELKSGTSFLVRLFALDRLPARRRLVCRWQRDASGRLAAIWEPDIDPACNDADH